MKQILLVEDSPTDAELLQSALKTVGATNPVNWISDGNQALKHLEQAELTAPIAAVIPSVMFLDLRLPGVSGFEILEYIQSRPAFSHMLCVALSHITDLQSMKRAYRYGAYSFLSKPVQPIDLRELIRSFPGYWTFGRATDALAASVPAPLRDAV
jgi:CheY-like chemotaxis protein